MSLPLGENTTTCFAEGFYSSDFRFSLLKELWEVISGELIFLVCVFFWRVDSCSPLMFSVFLGDDTKGSSKRKLVKFRT